MDKVYVSGLSDKISRDQLELSMETYADCEVVDVFYGVEPELAMVTFKDKIGKADDKAIIYIIRGNVCVKFMNT